MTRELQTIRRLAAALRENLAKCAEAPEVDPVHDALTGTRRLQATLENLVRETPEDAAGLMVRDRAMAVMRQLKKIRRAAGPLRDLDVHRKLLEKLTERALGTKKSGPGDTKDAAAVLTGAVSKPDFLESPEAGLRAAGFEQQAGDLDRWLHHRRNAQAVDLKKQAAAWGEKLDRRLAKLEEAMSGNGRRLRVQPPAVVALDAFARLASEMQLLDAANLHDFRKGAKKARYVAELAAQGDAHAGEVGRTLKKLQDEIGDWHDWLVLAEEAHAALGDGGAELTARIEAECERHYGAAMKIAVKLRGRLMGEWLASAGKRTSSKKRPAKSPSSRKQSAGARPGKKRAGTT